MYRNSHAYGNIKKYIVPCNARIALPQVFPHYMLVLHTQLWICCLMQHIYVAKKDSHNFPSACTQRARIRLYVVIFEKRNNELLFRTYTARLLVACARSILRTCIYTSGAFTSRHIATTKRIPSIFTTTHCLYRAHECVSGVSFKNS